MSIQEITKKEFCDLMTTNNIIFMRISKTFYEPEYIYNFVNDNYINSDSIIEQQTYTKQSKQLKSNNNSYLTFASDEYTKRKTYKYNFENFIVLVLQNAFDNYKFDDDYNEIHYTEYKQIYYLIKK